jgi:transcriptional regulator with XRE-family HTH domain
MELRVARQIARLSQRQLAERAGVVPSMISHLEANRRRYHDTKYGIIIRIAQALHADPLLLFPVEPSEN